MIHLAATLTLLSAAAQEPGTESVPKLLEARAGFVTKPAETSY